MNQAQESGTKSIFPEIRGLETQYSQLEKDITLDQVNEIIEKVTKLTKGVNFAEATKKYAKERFPDLYQAVKFLNMRTDPRKDGKKLDNQIAVEGQTGSGKSTLALNIMLILCALRGQKFSLTKDVLYFPKPAELSKRLQNLEKASNLWVDEAIKSLNKLNWFTQDAKASSETIQTERFRNNTILYCIPSFFELIKSFRNTNIRFRIWAISQDTAVMRIKDSDADMQRDDPWHTDDRIKLKRKKGMTVLSSTRDRVLMEIGLPGYFNHFRWIDLEHHPELHPVYFMYELNKKRSRLEMIQQNEEEQKIKNETPISVNSKKYRDSIIQIIKPFVQKNYTFENFYQEFASNSPLSKDTFQRCWNTAIKEADMQAAKDKNATLPPGTQLSNLVRNGAKTAQEEA